MKFEWIGLQVVDNEFELELSKTMLQNGAKTVNEWRLEQGKEPFDEEAADMPLVFTAGGPVTLESVTEEPDPVDPNLDPNADPNADPKVVEEQDDGEVEEMDKWEKKAINWMKQGKGAMPTFIAKNIDRAARNLINARLSVAKSKDEIKAAFAPFKADAMERSLVKRAMSVRKDIVTFKKNRYERTGQRTG